MCRSIKVLRNPQVPATDAEIAEASTRLLSQLTVRVAS